MHRTSSFLALFLGAVTWSLWAVPSASAGPPVKPFFAPLRNDEAWERLPRANPPLPAWARTLATSLPRTTVAMLELDHLHRANNPLGPVLAGKLRWMSAHAIGCAYAERYAEADLRRVGLPSKEFKRLAGDLQDLPAEERAALIFARKLTRAGYTVTDEEVAELLEHFGAERVVAMVHTIAYANFQNRIFLALRAEVEPEGPPEPPDVRLDPRKNTKPAAPPRPEWKTVRNATLPTSISLPPGWEEQTFADVEKALEKQKNKKGRIPLPGPERLAHVSPEGKAEASLVVWTNISAGYQPRLTKAWFDCMRTFQEEAKLDRVFSGFLFWVVTRSNECFYWMGHSQMGLAVAGLKDAEIAQRVRRLAEGDWSDFPPAERLAFQFASKLSREPWAVSDQDIQGLVETFGRHRAIDVIWRSSWYNYMTRVADAFQLPLERENVFQILQKQREKQEKNK